MGGGDVGEADLENVVLASGPSVRLLSQSPVRFGVGVGGCCCYAASDAQFLVIDAVSALE